MLTCKKKNLAEVLHCPSRQSRWWCFIEIEISNVRNNIATNGYIRNNLFTVLTVQLLQLPGVSRVKVPFGSRPQYPEGLHGDVVMSIGKKGQVKRGAALLHSGEVSNQR